MVSKPNGCDTGPSGSSFLQLLCGGKVKPLTCLNEWPVQGAGKTALIVHFWVKLRVG